MSHPAISRSSPTRLFLAWGVHLFTASGAVLAVMALLAIGVGDFSRAALLMLVALAIDSVDGTLARAVGVSEVLPDIDGRRLDDIVDYLNYAIVPVAFMAAAGLILSWGWLIPPVLASAYGFSQHDAKTEDDFFLGWPSYWNVLALYLWLLALSPEVGTLWVVGCTVAVFVPLKYVYASRIKQRLLRQTATIGGLAWALVLGVAILLPDLARSLRLVEISLIYPAYYVVLSIWLGDWKRGWRQASGGFANTR
jgi:phosphatidylcholine synthase